MKIKLMDMLIFTLIFVPFNIECSEIELNEKWQSTYCMKHICTLDHMPYSDYNDPIPGDPEIDKNNLWNFWQASKSNKKDFKRNYERKKEVLIISK